MKDLNNYGFNTSKLFYTVAEIGINHGGDEDLAKKLIDSAARAGVLILLNSRLTLLKKEWLAIHLFLTF